MPDLPGLERLEPPGRRPAGGRELRALIAPSGSTRRCIPTSARSSATGFPTTSSRASDAQAARLVRLRRRVRPRRLPAAGASAPGRRRRRARPGRRQGHLPPLRAVCGAPERRQLEGRFGRHLEPALQPPAPRRLDVRRRGGPADPAGPGALRRGRRGRHPACAALHRRAHASAHIYPARHDAGDSDPSLPPMGLRVRLKASVDISRLSASRRASSCRRSRPTG